MKRIAVTLALVFAFIIVFSLALGLYRVVVPPKESSLKWRPLNQYEQRRVDRAAVTHPVCEVKGRGRL